VTNKVHVTKDVNVSRNSIYDLFMQAPVPIAVFHGPNYVVIVANLAVCEFWGKTHDEVFEKPLFEAIPEAKEQGYEELLAGVYKTGVPYRANGVSVKLFRRQKLETVYFNFIYQPVRENDGTISGVIVIAQDITEQLLARKEVEQLADKLKQQTEMYQEVLAGVSDFIYTFDISGKFIFANKPLLDLLGISLEQIVGKTFHDLPYPSELANKLQREIHEVVNSAEELTGETTYTSPSGERGYYEYILVPTLDSTHKVVSVAGSTRNITIRKQIEEGLRQSEEQLRFMAETVPQKVFTAKPDGNVDYFNSPWEEYTGLSFEQLRTWGWVQFVHPDDVDENITKWQQAINTGKPFQFEHRFRRHDGVYRWHLSRARAFTDQNGEITMWAGSNTDIEDLKQGNDIKKRITLLTKQRNALIKLNDSKNDFMAIASHQLRTPATAVKQYIDLLMDGYAGEVTADQLQYLQIAYDSNERQLGIINDLLKTVQLDAQNLKLNKSPYNIAQIISEVISELQPILELKKQTIVLEVKDRDLVALIDESEMKLVLINLFENASKYSYPNQEIIVHMEEKDHHVQIKVIDKGVGISKQNQKRIFEKFTRINNDLSDTVSGSGLGLYWVKRIVKLHQGSIKVTSALYKGSTFMIQFPL
jgi:PAS domain S-box-containing protein